VVARAGAAAWRGRGGVLLRPRHLADRAWGQKRVGLSGRRKQRRWPGADRRGGAGLSRPSRMRCPFQSRLPPLNSVNARLGRVNEWIKRRGKTGREIRHEPPPP